MNSLQNEQNMLQCFFSATGGRGSLIPLRECLFLFLLPVVLVTATEERENRLHSLGGVEKIASRCLCVLNTADLLNLTAKTVYDAF